MPNSNLDPKTNPSNPIGGKFCVLWVWKLSPIRLQIQNNNAKVTMKKTTTTKKIVHLNFPETIKTYMSKTKTKLHVVYSCVVRDTVEIPINCDTQKNFCYNYKKPMTQ